MVSQIKSFDNNVHFLGLFLSSTGQSGDENNKMIAIATILYTEQNSFISFQDDLEVFQEVSLQLIKSLEYKKIDLMLYTVKRRWPSLITYAVQCIVNFLLSIYR